MSIVACIRSVFRVSLAAAVSLPSSFFPPHSCVEFADLRDLLRKEEHVGEEMEELTEENEECRRRERQSLFKEQSKLRILNEELKPHRVNESARLETDPRDRLAYERNGTRPTKS